MSVRVTVAIPTRNRAEFLAESLASALAAAGPEDEVIVADNASTDRTGDVLAQVRDPRVRVLRHATDLGMVGNWDACLGAARGEFFLLLSDDDLLSPGALTALQAAARSPGTAVAYGRVRVIDERGGTVTLGHPAPPREAVGSFMEAWFGFRRSVYPCATLLRTADLRAVGGYAARHGPFADVGAWLGVWRAHPADAIAFVAEEVAQYRVHTGALSAAATLDADLASAERLAADHQGWIGPGATAGFTGLRAHYVASALRRRVQGRRFPALRYLAAVAGHWSAVRRAWHPAAYRRHWVILAAAERHERAKAVAAQAADLPPRTPGHA